MTFGPERCGPRKGVTLVEFLVVIGLIGLLMSVLLPAVQNVRAAAARASCQNNLRQIALALQNYHSSHGRMPPDGPAADLGSSKVLQTWMTLILPQIEQESLWGMVRRDYAIDHVPFDDTPHAGLAAVIPTYLCPADGRFTSAVVDQDGIMAGYTDYIGVSGAYTGATGLPGILAFGKPGVKLTAVTDGTSNTLAVGERPPPESLQAGWWYTYLRYPGVYDTFYGPDALVAFNSPERASDPCATGSASLGPGDIHNPCDRYHFWSLHSGGGNFALADGSVRFFTYSASDVLPAMGTINGGEIVQLP